MPLPLLLSPLFPSLPLAVSPTPCSSSCTLTPSFHFHLPPWVLATHTHFPLPSRCTLSSSPSLLMFWRWHTLQKPHDLWHCLVGQLLFPSMINFDVKPNEIRQLIKAAADSGLIYSCAWHPSKWQKKKKTNDKEFVCKVSSERSATFFICSSSALPCNGSAIIGVRCRDTPHKHAVACCGTRATKFLCVWHSHLLSSSLQCFLLTAPFPFSRL